MMRMRNHPLPPSVPLLSTSVLSKPPVNNPLLKAIAHSVTIQPKRFTYLSFWSVNLSASPCPKAQTYHTPRRETRERINKCVNAIASQLARGKRFHSLTVLLIRSLSRLLCYFPTAKKQRRLGFVSESAPIAKNTSNLRHFHRIDDLLSYETHSFSISLSLISDCNGRVLQEPPHQPFARLSSCTFSAPLLFTIAMIAISSRN